MNIRNSRPRIDAPRAQAPTLARWPVWGAVLALLCVPIPHARAQDPLAVGTVLGGPEQGSATRRYDDGAAAQPYVATDSYLDDLVAPIALYPDDLLALVLPAARFPSQIAEAADYLEQLKDDPDLGPDPYWDDSILALLNYPEVVQQLAADIDWTRRLGEAVALREAAVMTAAQRVRSRALAAGNLASDSYQRVERTRSGIVIRPANPMMLYVPMYEPALIFNRHGRTVVRYYPRPYPVYYYPYPNDYAFGTDFFWGLSSYYTIGWSTFSLGLILHDTIGHPFYDRIYHYTPFNQPYRYPVQRRTVTVHVFDHHDRRDFDDRDRDRRDDDRRDRDRRDDGDRNWRDDDDRERGDRDRRRSDGDNRPNPAPGGTIINRAWRGSNNGEGTDLPRVRPLAPSEEMRQEPLPTTRIETRSLRDIERPYDQERERNRRPQGSSAASVRVYEQRVDETPSATNPQANPEPRSRREANPPGANRVRELRSDPPAPQVTPATPNPVEQRPATVNRAWRDSVRREANEERARPAAPRGAEPQAYRAPLPQPAAAPNQAPAPEAANRSDDDKEDRRKRRERERSED